MQSGAFWDSILRNVYTVGALTSSCLDDFSDIVTYILLVMITIFFLGEASTLQIPLIEPWLLFKPLYNGHLSTMVTLLFSRLPLWSGSTAVSLRNRYNTYIYFRSSLSFVLMSGLNCIFLFEVWLHFQYLHRHFLLISHISLGFYRLTLVMWNMEKRKIPW